MGQKGEYGRAADDSSRAIREAPSAMAYYTRALAYHDLGEDEQAIRDCNEALAIDPKSENALFVRGAARQHLADYSGAIKDYSDVLRFDPSRADALFARGIANYSSGEHQAAVADFSKAMDLGYADAIVFHLRELAESELGHRSDARSDRCQFFPSKTWVFRYYSGLIPAALPAPCEKWPGCGRCDAPALGEPAQGKAAASTTESEGRS
jgi:tetratricopeptide (TPR) repeat protein